MMTAGSILRHLAARRRQAEIAAICDLAESQRAAVVDALGSVPPGAQVDIDKLVETMRREAAERARAEAARAPDPMDVLRYRLSLASRGELVELRDELRAEAAPSTALAGILSKLEGIARRLTRTTTPETPRDARGHGFDDAREQPDEEADDAETAPRRRVRRVRPQQSERESPGPPRGARRPLVLRGRIIGAGADDRPYGAPEGLGDYSAWKSPGRPPWLITEGDADGKSSPAD